LLLSAREVAPQLVGSSCNYQSSGKQQQAAPSSTKQQRAAAAAAKRWETEGQKFEAMDLECNSKETQTSHGEEAAPFFCQCWQKR